MEADTEACISLAEITELRQFGNKLLNCKDIKEVTEESFNKIEQKLNPQVISLFLLSKNGLLERFKIHGIDSEGESISDDWLKSESYNPGDSFSGRAAAPTVSPYGSPYGDPYINNGLDQDINKMIYGESYVKRLGFLKCGISVPLNGTYRTFGTIEVLNKKDNITHKPNDNLTFTQSELCWLTIVGAHVSAAISRLRKIDESKVYATISRNLASYNDNRHSYFEEVYKSITEQLIGDLTPYKVCILRMLGSPDTLFVKAVSHTPDIDMSLKGNAVRVIREESIVAKVFRNLKPEKVERIEERINEFKSVDWINKQNLKSFVCFPLVIKEKAIGTLSLFTGYEHNFSENDIEFLENVSHLLAAYAYRVGVKEVTIIEKNDKYKTEEKLLFYNEEKPMIEKYLYQEYERRIIELEERLSLINNKQKNIVVNLLLLIFQLALVTSLLVISIYIIFLPYIDAELFSYFPAYSAQLAAFMVVIISFWVYLIVKKTKLSFSRFSKLTSLRDQCSYLINKTKKLAQLEFSNNHV